MIRVSSNLTLFLKVILPMIWIIFYGSFSVGFLFVSGQRMEDLGPVWIKYIFWLVFITGSIIIYYSLWQLKRVEFGAESIYVSNYKKEYHYDYSDLSSIDERNYGLFKVGRIKFKMTTSFGNQIIFLIAENKYQKFIKEHPELFLPFLTKEEQE